MFTIKYYVKNAPGFKSLNAETVNLQNYYKVFLVAYQ